jgi:hypothetical protein
MAIKKRFSIVGKGFAGIIYDFAIRGYAMYDYHNDRMVNYNNLDTTNLKGVSLTNAMVRHIYRGEYIDNILVDSKNLLLKNIEIPVSSAISLVKGLVTRGFTVVSKILTRSVSYSTPTCINVVNNYDKFDDYYIICDVIRIMRSQDDIDGYEVVLEENININKLFDSSVIMDDKNNPILIVVQDKEV